MKETWQDIPEYEGLYQASTLGRIRNTKTKVLKALVKNSVSGYYYVSLYKGNKHKCCLVSRIIASTFIPNPDNLPEIDHINGNKALNAIWNLRWCDRSGNQNNPITRARNSKSKIGKYTYATHPNAKPILQLTLNGEVVREWDCIKSAAEHLGIKPNGISQAIKNVSHHTAGGYRWQYK